MPKVCFMQACRDSDNSKIVQVVISKGQKRQVFTNKVSAYQQNRVIPEDGDFTILV